MSGYLLKPQVSASIFLNLTVLSLVMIKHLTDYIVQGARYEVLEELGCANTEVLSGLSIILIESWSIIFPFISLVYYARE